MGCFESAAIERAGRPGCIPALCTPEWFVHAPSGYPTLENCRSGDRFTSRSDRIGPGNRCPCPADRTHGGLSHCDGKDPRRSRKHRYMYCHVVVSRILFLRCLTCPMLEMCDGRLLDGSGWVLGIPHLPIAVPVSHIPVYTARASAKRIRLRVTLRRTVCPTTGTERPRRGGARRSGLRDRGRQWCGQGEARGDMRVRTDRACGWRPGAAPRQRG